MTPETIIFDFFLKEHMGFWEGLHWNCISIYRVLPSLTTYECIKNSYGTYTLWNVMQLDKAGYLAICSNMDGPCECYD